jgi:hypothetical protein
VAVRDACGKARAHTRHEGLLALVGPEHHFALEDENELVLERVKVPHRRLFARRKRRQIHADLREAEGVAECTLRARENARSEWFRISGARARSDTCGIERGWFERHPVPITLAPERVQREVGAK